MKACPESIILKINFDTQLFKRRFEIPVKNLNLILCVQMPLYGV